MQKTIAKEIEISGVGIHSGNKVTMKLIPADENTGIVFRDINGSQVAAKFDNVTSTNMSTKLSNGSFHVDVVEHLMGGLWGSDVDNLIIEIDANETPICDGSAIEFIKRIQSAGLKMQNSPRNIYKVSETIEVREDDKYVIISPNPDGLIIDMTIDFEHKAIGKQHIIFNSKTDSFVDEIAPARTFGFVKDLEFMHSKGLALGASLENCIGLDEEEVTNPEGLRFPNEFVRHKVLDCIGDLFLSGYYIHGYVKAYKTGHKLNNLALRKLLSD